MEYKAQYEAYLAQASKALDAACGQFLPETSEVCRAARYSLLGGGKRIRAVLVLSVCDLLGGDKAAAGQFAAAVEMLHCYSLIHDDLPCMDNDDLRRGRPSCHKAFDEATAMLAGDVLLTEAFEVVANAPASAQACVRAARALGAGAGSRGMVYGQELDLKYEALAATEDQLRLIHRNKTGALINAAVQMGAAAAEADTETCRVLEAYAYGLGLVFQIVDDVLDVTSTPEQLGKPIGSDSENGKTTFATLYGVQGAMDLAQKLNAETCAQLHSHFGTKAAFLEQLAQQLLVRKS
ncbi:MULTISPECIES: polyprenyl synthetase family protein [Faecalibacterium]|jgi:geranylgeranyl diphosphate synthase type II|uniref:Geranyl transferase n=1 Tax=Faecalibacterium langellae TaxID=3435293 RepID=A0ACC9CY39_9FIRM|nr:farnesyl diphosphate synthase [Faecalibacterium prausnitzii]MDU8689976.1 polyprenyl synthetase family protein [Faecalibacterium prausnitzii]PDX60659.1 geranyl transferase [Faecalibacterium prausnitzii]HAQ97522.1 polyprenyl synthetase family protein [Faecalibacterium sp.]